MTIHDILKRENDTGTKYISVARTLGQGRTQSIIHDIQQARIEHSHNYQKEMDNNSPQRFGGLS